ncbi:hypothetical protein Tco_0936068, partial [Tanacetum coccineum]
LHLVVTKESFLSYSSLEDIQLSAQKKNLIPLLFNVDVNEVGNILVENSESKECKEAVDGLLSSHEFKFKENEGNWRLGVAKTAGILKGKLGRMSTVEPEIESFYENLFPKNKIFVGRQKELADRSPRSDKINIDEFFNHGALEGKEPDVDTTFSNELLKKIEALQIYELSSLKLRESKKKVNGKATQCSIKFKELEKHESPYIVVALIGNKADLQEVARCQFRGVLLPMVVLLTPVVVVSEIVADSKTFCSGVNNRVGLDVLRNTLRLGWGAGALDEGEGVRKYGVREVDSVGDRVGGVGGVLYLMFE